MAAWAGNRLTCSLGTDTSIPRSVPSPAARRARLTAAQPVLVDLRGLSQSSRVAAGSANASPQRGWRVSAMSQPRGFRQSPRIDSGVSTMRPPPLAMPDGIGSACAHALSPTPISTAASPPTPPRWRGCRASSPWPADTKTSPAARRGAAAPVPWQLQRVSGAPRHQR
jgi:hypothetical protein